MHFQFYSVNHTVVFDAKKKSLHLKLEVSMDNETFKHDKVTHL